MTPPARLGTIDDITRQLDTINRAQSSTCRNSRSRSWISTTSAIARSTPPTYSSTLSSSSPPRRSESKNSSTTTWWPIATANTQFLAWSQPAPSTTQLTAETPKPSAGSALNAIKARSGTGLPNSSPLSEFASLLRTSSSKLGASRSQDTNVSTGVSQTVQLFSVSTRMDTSRRTRNIYWVNPRTRLSTGLLSGMRRAARWGSLLRNTSSRYLPRKARRQGFCSSLGVERKSSLVFGVTKRSPLDPGRTNIAWQRQHSTFLVWPIPRVPGRLTREAHASRSCSPILVIPGVPTRIAHAGTAHNIVRAKAALSIHSNGNINDTDGTSDGAPSSYYTYSVFGLAGIKKRRFPEHHGQGFLRRVRKLNLYSVRLRWWGGQCWPTPVYIKTFVSVLE